MYTQGMWGVGYTYTYDWSQMSMLRWSHTTSLDQFTVKQFIERFDHEFQSRNLVYNSIKKLFFTISTNLLRKSISFSW